MPHRISTPLRALRPDLAARLGDDVIAAAGRAAGHTGCDSGLLTPAAILHWSLIPVLHGDTALTHVSLLAGRAFSASASCQARARLPLAVFGALLRDLVRAVIPDTEAIGRWRGHRTSLVDGSSFSRPDTAALRAAFGRPGNQAKGSGFPAAHPLALFQAGTGFLLEVAAAPSRTSDFAGLADVLGLPRAGEVPVADRGSCSFAGSAPAMSRGIHAVFRLHQEQIVDFTPGRAHARPGRKRGPKGMPRTRWIRARGLKDQVVESFKPAERPDRMSEAEYRALPESIVVRELRYRIDVPGSRTREVTPVTTLIDAAAYPADELASLYGTRWPVEESLKALKVTMKMDVLKCMTVEGVPKELTMYAVAYNLVRVVMGEAAARQGGAVVDRLSFIEALRWLGGAEAGEERPEWVVNPRRPGRSGPRCKKRRPKPYGLMRLPRAGLRKRLREEDLAA